MISALFDSASYHGSVSAYLYVGTGAVLFVVTLIVLLRQRSSRPARLFAATTLAVALWQSGFGMMLLSRTAATAVIWGRFGIAAATFIPIIVIYFSRSLFRLAPATRHRLLWAIVLLAAATTLTSDLIIADVTMRSWGWYPALGDIGFLLPLFFLLMLGANLVEYRRQYVISDAKRRMKIKRLVLTFLLAYCAAVDFLPLLGAEMHPFSFVFIWLFMLYGARSIIRYRMAAISPSYAANEIIDTMADALLVADGHGRIQVANHAVTPIFGYLPEELIGQRLDTFIADPDATLASVTRLRRALSGGTLRDQERIFRAKDGTEVEVSISVSPLSRGTGTVITARDIRERKLAEREIKQGSSLLKSTLESTSDGMVVIDNDGRLVLHNNRFGEMWRLLPNELLQLSEAKLISRLASQVTEPELFNDTFARLRNRSEAESFDVVTLADGRIFERHSVPQKIDRITVGRVWTYRDVTESRRAEANLRASERRYRALFERNLAGVYRNRLDGTIVDCNEAFARIFGYSSAAELVTKNAAELFFNPHEREAIVDMLRDVKNITSLELCLKRKDGGRVWVLENISLIEEANGEPAMMEGTLVDISGLKLAEEQMEFQAYHDVLTCLPNRKLFIDRLTLALAQARRSRGMLAVMFIDLDHFKIINDTLGHTAGDELLLCIADRLSRCVRDGDTVARLGGDEFTLLINNLHEADDAARVAEQILEAVEEPLSLGDRQLFVTASLGIALSPADGMDAETLLKNADSALYRAKESGRNNYQLCTEEMKVRAIERLSLENSLRRALERGELLLHYQPVVNLSTGRVSGMEALIRWEHPERGLTYPDSFIPLAESSRLIVPIGDWVLREACRQARNWYDRGFRDFRISVNLSPKQFQQRDLIQSIRSALEESALEPSLLELEITETTAMANVELTIETLHELKAMGIAISIDDFGIGYSSLNYLKRFPINTVKIDKSFVRDLETDASDAAIVSAVIGIARILNLRVIAEGVETERQLAFLQRKECEEMQGYLFSAPLSPEEAERLVAGGGSIPSVTSRVVAN